MEEKIFSNLNKKLERISLDFDNEDNLKEFENLYLKEIPNLLFKFNNETSEISSNETLNRAFFICFVDYLEFIGKEVLKELNETALINNKVWCIRTGLLHIILDYKKIKDNEELRTDLLMKTLSLRYEMDEIINKSKNFLVMLETFFDFCKEKVLLPIWVLNALSMSEAALLDE